MIIKSKLSDTARSLSDSETELLQEQHEIVSEFFKRDRGAEIVDSLNALLESFLFTEGNVTPEMRIHIANQLRVVTLITQLGETSNALKYR